MTLHTPHMRCAHMLQMLTYGLTLEFTDIPPRSQWLGSAILRVSRTYMIRLIASTTSTYRAHVSRKRNLRQEEAQLPDSSTGAPSATAVSSA